MSRTSQYMVGAALLLASATIAVPRLGRAADIADLAERAKPSVVLLTILGPTGEKLGNGSGFFISESGVIVTNQHVIAPASDIEATLADGSKRAIRGVLARDPENDLAIIQAEGSGFPALRLGSSLDVRQGDTVAVIGSPHGLSGTLSTGIVSALREGGIPDTPWNNAAKDARLIQIDAAISPGSSGSPVLDAEGSVIGVAVAVIRGAQNLNFAVPVEAARVLYGTVSAEAEPQPFRGFPLNNLLISIGFFALVGVGAVLGPRLLRKKPMPKNLS